MYLKLSLFLSVTSLSALSRLMMPQTHYSIKKTFIIVLFFIYTIIKILCDIETF